MIAGFMLMVMVVGLAFISVGIVMIFQELIKVNTNLTAIAEYNKKQLRLMEKHDRTVSNY